MVKLMCKGRMSEVRTIKEEEWKEPPTLHRGFLRSPHPLARRPCCKVVLLEQTVWHARSVPTLDRRSLPVTVLDRPFFCRSLPFSLHP